MRRVIPLICAAFLSIAFGVANAHAAGGKYVFDGGTNAERQQVVKGLDASSFDWSLVPETITIHIKRGVATSQAIPGQIWLDANLLDSGQFSWGTVQMEYAHQVHFFLLDDGERAALTGQLGAKAWCWNQPGLAHADNGCERFAATLAWAYWPSQQNAMKPAKPGDESASMAPAQFRAELASLIAQPAAQTPAPAPLVAATQAAAPAANVTAVPTLRF